MEPCLGILEDLSCAMSQDTPPSGTISPKINTEFRNCTEKLVFSLLP